MCHTVEVCRVDMFIEGIVAVEQAFVALRAELRRRSPPERVLAGRRGAADNAAILEQLRDCSDHGARRVVFATTFGDGSIRAQLSVRCDDQASLQLSYVLPADGTPLADDRWY
jgi:hypothetical protein